MSREALEREAGKHKVALDDRGMMDVPFLVLVLLLVAIGLIMMFSASYVRSSYEEQTAMTLFAKQAVVAAIGIVVMFVASLVPYPIWMKLDKVLYGFAVVLLLLVLFMGVEAGGAKRWIRVAGQQFQPSEVAKFCLICMLASLMTRYRNKMHQFSYGVLRVGAAVGGILLLVVLEKHLSAIMIIGLVSMVMMYVGGTRKQWLLAAVAVALVFIYIYVNFMGYAGDRITAWLNPEAYARDEGYQILQSQYAVGSGGLFGLGFGKGRQKYLYLPEEHNDYIFAIVCEELGFIGALGIIILFALLVIRGYWIAMHAADRFSTLLAVGITTLLAVQVVLNIGVVTNLLPSTGVGLPFFSYGGTNLLMNLGEMGIMLNISRWSSSTR